MGPVDARTPIEFVVRVRPRTNAEPLGPNPVGQAPEADEDLERTVGDADGADPADLDKIQEFAHQTGFTIVDVSVPGRSVVLCGTAADISSIFRVELANYKYAGDVRRGQVGPIYLPRTIVHIVEEITGLDDDLPDDFPVRAAFITRGARRLAAQPFVLPLLALLAGSVLGAFLFRGAGAERPARLPSTTLSAPQHIGAPSAVTSGGALRKLELAGWKALEAGRLREAQDDFLNVLSLDPSRRNVLQGLVTVRRRMGRDDPHLIRQQMAVYQEAINSGSGTGEYYTQSALSVLVAASLRAAQELEAQNGPTAARPASTGASASPPAAGRAALPQKDKGSVKGQVTPPATPTQPTKTPSKPADHPVAPPATQAQKPPVTAAPPAQVRPATPAPQAASLQSAPVVPPQAPPIVPAQKPSVAGAPQVPSAQNAPVSSSPGPPATTTPPPVAAPQVPPLAPDRLYTVQIGPVTDRARASAIAAQLSVRGLAGTQVIAHTGYRVVSEPLPRKEADNLAATLSQKGIRSYAEPLTGETVQLLFGVFTVQREAETLANRIAAAGYDAWLREAVVYTLHLGPYPTPTVSTITDIVKAGAPEATVTPLPTP